MAFIKDWVRVGLETKFHRTCSLIDLREDMVVLNFKVDNRRWCDDPRRRWERDAVPQRSPFSIDAFDLRVDPIFLQHPSSGIVIDFFVTYYYPCTIAKRVKTLQMFDIYLVVDV